MANIQPLVDYLKINRRSQEAERKETTTAVEVIDQYYNSNSDFDNTTIEVLKTEIGNSSYYRALSLSYFVDTENPVYINIVDNNNLPNSIIYYERSDAGGVIKYRQFTDIEYLELDDSNFLEKQLIHHKSVYYYNATTNRIIISNASTGGVFLFQDKFGYDSNNISIDAGTHKLDYKDHEGYDTSIFDSTLKAALDPLFKGYFDGRNRKIEVGLSPVDGNVYLFPLIAKDGLNYTLRYVYVNEEETLFGVKFNNAAISLKFRYLGAFLEFLNQTVFYDGDFDTLTGYRGIRQKFLDDYLYRINQELSSTRDTVEKSLEILYYTPEIFLQQVNNAVFWDIIGKALEQNLTNIGLNEEDIILKLLRVLSAKSKTQYIFLTELLVRKTSNKSSYFKALYDKLNGDNFVKYTQFLNHSWRQSSYVKLNLPDFNGITDGPPILPYTSDKTLGFYHSNCNLDYEKAENGQDVISTVLETGEYVYIERPNPKTTSGKSLVAQEIEVTHNYHPFYPLYIPNIEQQKTTIDFNRVVPLFFLKANEDKAFWSNVITAGEYTLDVVTTLSGVGNIAKFRHLAKIGAKAAKLSKVSRVRFGKAATFANRASKIKKAAAIVELSSGSLNLMLKLTGIRDSELGKDLSTVLAWLELLSLSGELTLAIRNGLRTSAKKALQREKALQNLRNAAKNTDETKEIDELVEFLEEAAKIVDNVKPRVIYQPLIYSDFSGLVALYNGVKNVFFYLENIIKPNTQTVFIRGVEVFTGTKAEVIKVLKNAEAISKQGGIKAIDKYFEALGSKLVRRRLHSQTGELYIGTLVKKKVQNKYYYYEIQDFQYHPKKNWNRSDKVGIDRFESFVTLADKPITQGRNILYADLFIPRALNDVLQANKVDGLTDISLGRAMLDDGLSALRRDIGGELDGVYGEWIRTPSYLDYGGESVNLTKLKEAMQGKDITEANLKIAAIETVTGKWAKSKGFVNVEIVTKPEKYRKLLNINDLDRLEVIITK